MVVSGDVSKMVPAVLISTVESDPYLPEVRAGAAPDVPVIVTPEHATAAAKKPPPAPRPKLGSSPRQVTVVATSFTLDL